MDKTQVLIVGAGPTGLAAAAILAKQGIQVRICDKNTARSTTSKALGVQAGTLECLERAFGADLPKKMVTSGFPLYKATAHIDGRESIDLDLCSIPSHYNYVLILGQSETERILEEEFTSLGGKVERQTEVTSLNDRGDHVECTLRTLDGHGEDILVDYVLGADGAHSLVRKYANIAFEGESYPGNFVLADVHVHWPFKMGRAHMFLNRHGAVACFPMNSSNEYRIILVPKEEIPQGSDSDKISIDEFRKTLQRMGHETIEILDTKWMTRFRLHHRMVQKFRQGRLFLAGDAAHIHSPVGGQGMNTGIQDALNLGFKLNKVLRGEAPDSLLDSYEKERKPVARSVLRATDFPFKLLLRPEDGLMRFVRGTLIPNLIGRRFVQKPVIKAMSEIGVAREEIQRYP